MERTRTVRAMGTTAHLLAVGEDDRALDAALDAAVDRLHRLEARWTRFRDDSELAQLSAARGAPVVLSEDTASVLALALEAWRVTDGRFDPTLRDEVVAAGYDRPWPLAAGGPGARRRAADRASTVRPSPGDVVVLAEVGVAIAPEGAHLDLGAIGKGRAADLLVADLRAAGAAGVVVNIGGDLAVAGLADDGEPFAIDVEDPATGRARWRLRLAGGGVATSGTGRRRWCVDGAPAHHLIDPRTGVPSRSDLVAVTVVAGTAAWAEALATAALVAGAADGIALLERLGVGGLLVDVDGTVRRAGDWERHAAGHAPGADDLEPAIAGQTVEV